MPDRGLRGQHVGRATSYETEQPAAAARSRVLFECVSGHRFALTFAADADPVDGWTCPRCSQAAWPPGAGEPSPVVDQRRGRSPVEHLHQRRSDAELMGLLDEALMLLRDRGYTFGRTGGIAPRTAA